MKWSINQLNKYRASGLTLDEVVDVSELKEMNEDIRDISPVHVTGRADLGANKFTFHLHIQGAMVLPCSRTLVDVTFPFEIETTEVFLASKQEYEADTDVHYLQGEVLDLLPVIKENIILEIPMQIFSESASGGTPMQGQDWQVVTEQEKAEKVDPRLAGLAKFFDKQK
ncbi:YceD family protein [Microbacteriaceae bacterium 4G12]